MKYYDAVYHDSCNASLILRYRAKNLDEAIEMARAELSKRVQKVTEWELIRVETQSNAY